MTQPSPPSRGMWDWILTAGTAVLSVVAIVVSWLTFIDQQRLGESQIELNKEMQRRSEQRYASRVAWWFDAPGQVLDNSATVQVQNRSPVPIRNLHLTALVQFGIAREVHFVGGDLPPCSVTGLEFTLDNDPSSALGSRVVQNNEQWTLYFSDPNGTWAIGLGQARRVGAPPTSAPEGQLHHVVGAEPASDCGEGG